MRWVLGKGLCLRPRWLEKRTALFPNPLSYCLNIAPKSLGGATPLQAFGFPSSDAELMEAKYPHDPWMMSNIPPSPPEE